MKKLFTLAAAVLASFSLWAAETVNSGTYSTQTISEDFTTSTWAFAKPSSNVNIPIGAKENDIIYEASSSGKVKVGSNNLSWQGSSSVYIYVPAGAAGTISWTPSSTSESRYAQLYVNGEAAGEKRLYSRDSGTGEITTDGKKGPQSLAFTAADLTTRNDSTFLHFKDNNTELKIASIKVVLTTGDYANCEAPATPLVLKSDANETVYVGDVITLSTTGGSIAGIGIEGTAGETLGGLTGTTWTATVGAHTFVATQVAHEGYCAQESELVFNVLEKTPVASITIDGPAAGFIGQELTYTATADNATAYQWLVDGVDANTNAATFKYTAVKGDHSIVCKARNDFNVQNEEETWVESDPINLTVTKVCGMLIKATHTGATTASIDEASVAGGTVDKNTQSGGKLGSNGHYFGIKLAAGDFMPGDVVTIVAAELQGGNAATLFSDKGETALGSANFDTETLTAEITLTKSAEWIYLYRKDSGTNPVMGSISVTRSCEDSNDASIHSLTVNGEEVAKDAEANKYEYTVSASSEATAVEVAFEIHPLATASVTSPFNINVPAAGEAANGQAIKVTAEDGTEVTYTVFVSKSASLNNDATLKALAVNGLTLDPVFDPEVTAYTVTKAYEAELPAVADVTATATDANAKSVNVVLAENVFTITVTAEDNTTTKEYTITVNNAPAIKKINEVILSNGYSAYILEGQTEEPFIINGYYLAGEDAPTVRSYNVNEGTTWAIDGNAITLTGADASTATYTLFLEGVVPVEFTAEKITFDGTESWIKSGYGFATDKKWRFSKTDTDYSREIAGKTHIEMFLPACDTIVLTESNTATRDIKLYINGVQLGDKHNLEKNKDLTVVVEQSNAFMLTIESAQTSGDGGVGAIRMAKKEGAATAIDNAEAAVKAEKVIRDGQVLILRDGKIFNALGAEVK